MASKVLVVGAPQGNLESLFTKLAALHAKQSFVLCLILGDLFPQSTPDDDPTLLSLLSGSITVPLPTYFTLGACALPAAAAEKLTQNDNELCENLYFLGKRGVLTTSEGIRIVALGGKHDPNLVGSSTSTTETSFLPFFSGSDAAGLRGANHADMLVTYEWPEGVETGSTVELPEAVKERPRSGQIAELAKALRPRYHFAAGGDGFWEREPFRNDVRGNEGVEQRRATRFLSVADFGNAAKAKALYAFTVNPKEPQTIPANATASPFANVGSKKRGNPAGDDTSNGGSSFFWGDHTSGHHNHPRKRHQHQKRPPPGPDQCFFCLSNPSLEKHLIVSIGSEAYLTTAKGPLTSASTNPSELPFSSHILIIPLAHTPTLQQMDATDRETTVAEMRRYRDAIIKMLDKRGAGAVTFEIRKHDGVHAHWQVIPVKKEKLSIVDESFTRTRPGWIGEDELEDTDDAFTYWRSDAESGAVGRSIRIPPGEYFDLQFGRRVLATIIDAPAEATNWRDCVLSPEGEAKDADAFKKAFAEFDFTMEE